MYCGGSHVKNSAVVPDAVEFLFVCIDNLVAEKTGKQCVKKNIQYQTNIQSLKPPPKNIYNPKTKTIQNKTTLTAIVSAYCWFPMLFRWCQYRQFG